MKRLLYFVCVVTVELFAISKGAVAQMNQPPNDMLVYALYNSNEVPSVHIYDPFTATDKVLYQHENLFDIEVSSTGLIAITLHGGEIFLLDSYSESQELTNLSLITGIKGYPLSWSKDSQYLAIVSLVPEKDAELYIWNGTTAENITPDSEYSIDRFSQSSWSDNGLLAFTMYVEFNSEEFSEIFVWDGMSVMNLSQNPLHGDYSGGWNNRNEIVFLSNLNGEYTIRIWDGVSYRDGTPDSNTFVTLDNRFFSYFAFPSWNAQDEIVFSGQLEADSNVQVYAWNNGSPINLSQNPDAHNGGEKWSDDGYLAFVTYFSPEQLVIIHDPQNNVIFETEGQYTPAWSSQNQLVFCRSGWSIWLWDGTGLKEIAESGSIQAQWMSGQRTYCTSG